MPKAPRKEPHWDTITRGNRTYVRFRKTIKGHTHELTAVHRASIQKQADDLLKRAREQRVTPDEEITLKAWAERWLADKALELGPPGTKTIRNYRSVLDAHVLDALGTVKLRDVRAEHRRRLQRTLQAKGLKASTVNKVDGVLKAILQAAANEELPVVVSALTAVKPVRALPEKKRSLTTDNVRAIVATGGDWGAMWTAYAYTGARDAEVRALRWPDWDQAAGLLTIRHQLAQSPGDPPVFLPWLKGRKVERVVPVVPALAAALREHKARQNAARLAIGKHRWCPNDLIFPDEAGRALPHERVLRQFHAACEAAGIAVWKGLGVHALRHTANHLLREAGVDGPLRSQILGHSTKVNEEVYLDEDIALAREALAKMAAALG